MRPLINCAGRMPRRDSIQKAIGKLEKKFYLIERKEKTVNGNNKSSCDGLQKRKKKLEVRKKNILFRIPAGHLALWLCHETNK